LFQDQDQDSGSQDHDEDQDVLVKDKEDFSRVTTEQLTIHFCNGNTINQTAYTHSYRSFRSLGVSFMSSDILLRNIREASITINS